MESNGNASINTRGWLIGELSRLAEIPTATIRYYERLGLLLEPLRSPQGYRLYAPDALERLLFIQSAKAFGLSLEEVKQLLDLQALHTIPYATFKQMVSQHLEKLDSQIQELMTQRQTITQRLERIAEDLPDRDIQNSETPQNLLLNLMSEATESLLLEENQGDRPASINLFSNRSQEVLYMYSVGKRNFRLINLVSAKLNGANLSGADFTNAKLMLADLCELSAIESRFVGANLAGAIMSEACLQKANFTEALLMGVDLSGADLAGANFTSANLGGANFNGANLQEVNFSDAVLTGADFTNTKI
ncbi:pentapeptide repeat-containing protein [Pseudanabaena sp. FACHB-1998]|uniref:pentapeptide repeat-containing protein n=1 Tax=Pseudanabaena sp. FACHB-1998 TaxID=2692858 RepID=UPI001681469B|nr:pentapeptide repeat-containing protein [Pseudanabaena sp. FACHB-1998]MBD2175824.1 pentapeptide repeat-containing protein [Pseudanabaena sp. FACHB-1998]